eukprot:Blabericola_migrator_1__5151@NODE_265_length_10621_cov_160_318363_g221_i0_p4_GENE_NODE_265_length_10621_cov_160_318363_g221_i0NODE_265_length_10621_cov_160_318363_g221_i0_p4_ORF_typecomplete_len380_score57_22cEGF/PF12662_7/0_13cEGF/PF12662_7/2e03cEGF/PF12662_7/13cEGF/PF12662_7/71cEGF/PF12662_7/8_6cEGF/PF12662_7/79cEGF/PF12662_7/4_5e03_NODE_265_length_10621_cov_160_318363_g221_i082719410
MKSFFAFAFIVSLVQAGPHDLTGKNPPQITCPPGFTLTGKKCEQIITQTPQSVCPTGTYDNGQCVVYAATQKICPPGATPVGKDCIATEVFPAHASCPAGFIDNGKGCIQTKTLPLVDICEAGIMDPTGQCVVVETTEKITTTYCPAGYIDEGKGCMQITEYDCSPPIHGKETLIPALPPPPPFFGGYKHKKRMLGAKKYGPVYAPVPLPVPPPAPVVPLPPPVVIPPPPPSPKINIVQQLCQRKDFANPIVETKCPPGYTEVGKKCAMKKVFPPMKKCSNGLPAHQCAETTTALPIFSCTTGILVGDHCEQHHAYAHEITCPAGYQMIGMQCAQYVSPQVICAPGLTLEGPQCVGRNYVEPTGIKVIQCTGKNCWQHA